MFGDLGFFFKETMFVGYILFALGCVLGLSAIAISSRFELSEKFHLITVIMGLIMLGVFIFTGVLEQLIIAALVLFVMDFMILIIDFRQGNNGSADNLKEENSSEKEQYSKFNEKKLYDELDHIKEEFSNVEIVRDTDYVDSGVEKKAEQIMNELKNVIVVEDPKNGRYFYKENGKMFHVAGCMSLQRTDKKDVLSTNSRTELLARGYKTCKVCNS